MDGWMVGGRWWAEDGWVDKWVDETEIRKAKAGAKHDEDCKAKSWACLSRAWAAMRRVWGALYQSTRSRARSGPWGRRMAA